MPEEFEEYIISVGNPVMGIFRYLVLTLPMGWAVKKGELPSEISYSVEANGLRWVLDGEAYHYVMNLTGDESFQLNIKCRPIKKHRERLPRGLMKHEAGSLRISGHPCSYIIGEKAVGLLRKESMQYLKLVFSCEYTGRSIELELLGRGDREGVRALLQALTSVRCHSA